jgi:hypothetical protein
LIDIIKAEYAKLDPDVFCPSQATCKRLLKVLRKAGEG